jgi:hypothetical protein
MQRKAFIGTVLAAFAAALLAHGMRHTLRGGEQQPQCPPPLLSALPQADDYMGVGRCASPACHGGPATASNDLRKGKWNSSYTIWVEKDRKHAQAYNVLHNEQSKNIARNLGLSGKPYEEARCLACHSTVSEVSHDGRAIEADGVSCEACHGAARNWLTDHYARDFNRATSRMADTVNMASRAEICVACHVGSRGADGLPARNMDHDMIAAGHPRLTFEFRTYLASMPRHWNDSKEKSRKDYAAHTWAVGQVAAAEGALRLLAARAKAAADGKGRWPEFSEYNCFTCHHGLAVNSYRQRTPRERPGRYVWGSWYLPTTRLLASGFPDNAGLLTKAETARQHMSAPFPSAEAVASSGTAAADCMRALRTIVDCTTFDRKVMDPILAATVAQPATDWDMACGQYLFLRAVYSNRAEFDAPLKAMGELLQYRDVKQENGPPIRYNSPFDFDPDKFNLAKKRLFEPEQNRPSAPLPTP